MQAENKWPTRNQDMQAAETIIDKYMARNGGKPLGIVEVRMAEGQAISLKTPSWIVELVEHFSQQYGKEQGQTIVGKVLTRYLLKGEVIH